MKLFGDKQFKTGGSIVLIPNDHIVFRKVSREIIHENEIKSLASSIQSIGIIQPLLVRRLNVDSFEVVSGKRRLIAANMVGLPTVPCIILSAQDDEVLVYSIIENMQREDLHFFEYAKLLYYLTHQYQIQQEELSKKLGISQSSISNKLRLLALNPEIRQLIIENKLTERHARALLRLKDDIDRKNALLHIINKNLTVNETDKYIDSLLSPVSVKPKTRIVKLKDIKIFINTINHAVDTMRKAGIQADSHEYETSEYYEYVVRIPKLTSSPVNIA